MEYLLGANDLRTEFAELAPADQGLEIDWTGRNPDEAPSVVPYEKGALFLRMLEETVGREKFDAFLRAYFDDNAFQSMSTEEFIGIVAIFWRV